MPLPFQKQQVPPPQGGHIVGQPFTIANLTIPVSCHFTCNCVPSNQPMLMIGSAAVRCEVCGKGYTVAFNPANGQVIVAMTAPETKEAS